MSHTSPSLFQILSRVFSPTILAVSLAVASIAAAPAALCADHSNESAAKANAKVRPHPKAQPESRAEEPDADISGTTTIEFHCELGNKITLFQNDNDDSHIALRWKKRIHRFERVGTTTGALRFENRAYGLVWIGIPSKGMLLDSKLNRQLANECKNTDQSKPAVVEPDEAKKS